MRSHQEMFGKSCMSWHWKLFGDTHSPFLLLMLATSVAQKRARRVECLSILKHLGNMIFWTWYSVYLGQYIYIKKSEMIVLKSNAENSEKQDGSGVCPLKNNPLSIISHFYNLSLPIFVQVLLKWPFSPISCVFSTNLPSSLLLQLNFS